MHKILFPFLIFSLMPVQNYSMWKGLCVRAQQGFEALLKSDYESEDLGVLPIDTCSAVVAKKDLNVDDTNVAREDINVGSIAAICAAMAAVGVITHHAQRDNPGVQPQQSMTQKIASCEDVLDWAPLRTSQLTQQKNNFFNDSGYGNFFKQRLTPDDSPNFEASDDEVIFAQVSSSQFQKVQTPDEDYSVRQKRETSVFELPKISLFVAQLSNSPLPAVAQARSKSPLNRKSPLSGWVEISDN